MKMLKRLICVAAILTAHIGAVQNVRADIVVVNPSDDGSLYDCKGCNPVSNGAYVLVSGYIQGIIKFPTISIAGPITQAFLTVNPYGLPLWAPDVDVYGITGTSGLISADDINAGTFLGTLHLPSNLNYGQDAYFDVTAFMASASTPFVGFNLRSPTGPDVFSSIEYNYGHPSQLLVTVPEPAPQMLLIVAAGILLLLRMKRGHRGFEMQLTRPVKD